MSAGEGERKVCAHCLSTVPIERWSLIDGKWFCCHGCRLAWQILNEAGLGDFYSRRDWKEAGLPEGAFETRYTDEELARYVTASGPHAEIGLLVEGVRCASCVWVMERLLLRRPGVVTARFSYSTRTARVRFDPAIIRPGEILALLSSIGYPARPFTPGEGERALAAERRGLLMRFGTAAFLSMQLMGASIGLYGGYLRGMEAESHLYLNWFSFAMATPVVFWCGWPFFAGSLRALKNRAADMDLLIGLGLFCSYSYSVYAMLIDAEVYFDSAAAIVTFVLLGRLVEAGARVRSVSGITRLMKLKPDRAQKVDGDRIDEVGADSLNPGDIILVRPGDGFPADGVVVDGSTEADESAVTGEPYPVARAVGDEVTSGTINLSAAVKVRVTASGAAAFISRIARLVEEAEARKPALATLADRVSAWFVPVVVILSALAFAGALLTGQVGGEALLRAVAVLVVACPCALGLATPLAVTAASARAGAAGLVFRGGDVVETLAGVDTVIFDKTGTLTAGKPAVTSITACGVSEDEVLRLAALAEAGSSHPIAKGIIREARTRGVEAYSATSRAAPGRGIALDSPEGRILVGSREFLAGEGVSPPEAVEREGIEAWVALNGACVGVIHLEDVVRPEAAQAVKALHALGLKTVMLTGDRAEEAKKIADSVGLSEWRERLSPDGKAEAVADLRKGGARILMVGDGINDAAALAGADVGCSMGGASDVAIDTADLILLRPDMGGVTEAISISRSTVRVIKQNLWWAFGYNGAALALAVTGLLAPLYAALAMAVSSVCVVLNSLRLMQKARPC